MTISKSTWKSFKREPQKFAVKAFGGQEVIVKPLSAHRVSLIAKRFPPGSDGQSDTIGYSAALISASVVDDVGGIVFEEGELVSEDFDAATFGELIEAVNEGLGFKKN